MKKTRKEGNMNSEWKTVKLGDVANMYQPKTISQEEMVDNGQYLVYGANGVIGRYDKYNHEYPQLLVTCRGATCGAINVSAPFSWITGNSMVVAQFEAFLHFDYLKYYLSKDEIMNCVITGAAQPQITRTNLSQLKIHYPISIEKQQEIAATLDKASELVEKRKAQLAELDTLAESIFYDMFGDPVTNENNFVRIQLGKISKVTSSKRVYQSELTNNGVPFYKISDLMNRINQLVVDNSSFITEELYNRLFDQGNCPKFGDILVTSRGTLGECYIVKPDDKFYFQDGMISWLLPNTSLVNSIYLKYAFKTVDIKQQIEGNSNGATVNYLSISKLRELNFILPPLSLQHQFAQRIEKIEQQKQKVKAALKESEDLFQRLMQDMFNPEYHNS